MDYNGVTFAKLISPFLVVDRMLPVFHVADVVDSVAQTAAHPDKNYKESMFPGAINKQKQTNSRITSTTQDNVVPMEKNLPVMQES